LLQRPSSSLPLRLQAYERMTLFMERINPSQLMVRIVLQKQNDYQNFVIAQIEHLNIIYPNKSIFQRNVGLLLLPPKNATIQMMRLAAKNENIKDADGLRQAVISDLLKTISEQCISFFIKMKWENCGKIILNHS
jgi:hypothetical protein